jgi:DNA (cytosine-5)-methyltransferase 1
MIPKLTKQKKVLDLFCCEGGAGSGYALAGYLVTGVDIVPQPRNPYKVIVSDALKFLRERGGEYDLIHASPPCQGYSHLTPASHKGNYKKLIPELRDILKLIKKPYVIENVAGARMELNNPIMLCGSMFGLRTRRHRWFETSFYIEAPCGCNHSEIPLLVTTASKASRAKRKELGMVPKSVKNAPLAYGIGWMSSNGLRECIPPAYTLYIGKVARKIKNIT